jgi:hypothetical protein
VNGEDEVDCFHGVVFEIRPVKFLFSEYLSDISRVYSKRGSDDCFSFL